MTRDSGAGSLPVDADARLTVTVRVSDVARSVEWYRRVFDRDPVLNTVDRSLDGRTTPVAGFRLGGVLVWLSPLPAGTRRNPEHNDRHPTLAVMTRRELAPLYAELVSRGARTRDDDVAGFPAGADGVRRGRDADFFWIYDPDENRIEFCRALGPG